MNARPTAKRFPANGHARFSERIPASTPRNLLKSVAQSFLIVLIILIVSAGRICFSQAIQGFTTSLRSSFCRYDAGYHVHRLSCIA